MTTQRTLLLSSWEEYLQGEIDTPEAAAEEVRGRQVRLQRFPHTVMVKLSFPELDYAERWCWRSFGPMDGECRQKYSQYRVCLEEASHAHVGTWLSHWHVKTDYDFGYCEFYFAESNDQN
jgi:hypothetical protein